jgi:ketosteroid isomerase-like protein
VSQPATTPVYPAVPDTRFAADETVAFFASFFAAKNAHDVSATMEHFSPQVVTYTDVTLGWPFDGFDIIEGVFQQYMPTWPDTALSYPTRLLGGPGSALVAFTDTPELFGGELRLLGAVDFRDGKIVRWADYWDSTRFDDELYAKIRTPAEGFSSDLKESEVGVNEAPAFAAIATALQSAFAAGDAHAAAELFAYDAVYEDMALRIQLLGRADIERYLGGALAQAPFGTGSRLRHIVGGDVGGGVEWFPAPESSLAGGITALEVDASSRVTRVTTVYDGRQVSESTRRSLVLRSVGLDD